MKRFIFSTIIFFIATLSNAQVSQLTRATDYLTDRGEVFVSFEIPEGKSPVAFSNSLSIDRVSGNTVYAFVNQQEFDQFLELGIDFKIVDDYYTSRNITMATTVAEMANWDRYPTYGVYLDMMNGFANNYPELCKIYNIGATASGTRHLYFAKITSNVNEYRQKAQFMYTSTIHGDETTGFVLLLRLIDYLLSNYGTNAEVTYLLDNLEIWICPNENPDGTYRDNNNNLTNARRNNNNNLDLNRNYPNPWGSSTGSIQAETQAMMNFTDTMKFVMSANMHGGIELVNYPWDSWKSNVKKHADHDWYYLISREYADTAQFFSPSWYMTDYGGVTHGGDWYVIYGGRQDYMNFYAGIREVTLEISGVKLLPSAQLPAHWIYNSRSFINYMKQSLYGIQGVVKDINTLEPLAARIQILNHDKDNSEVYSYLPTGKFHRPIQAGTYNLIVSADGYPEKYISNVLVQNYQGINIDVLLGTPYTAIDEVEADMVINLYPNPVNLTSKIDLNLQKPGNVSIFVLNLNGQIVANVFSGFLQQGVSSINLGSEVCGLSNGVYVLKANYPGGSNTTKFLVL